MLAFYTDVNMSSVNIKIRGSSCDKDSTKNEGQSHGEFGPFVGVDLHKRVVTLKVVDNECEISNVYKACEPHVKKET